MHGEARLAEVLEAGGGVAEHAQGGGAPARARDQVKQEQEVVACKQCVFENNYGRVGDCETSIFAKVRFQL